MGAKIMTKLAKWLVLLGLFLGFATTSALADRLKDMTSIAGVRSNQLVGYGVVENTGHGDGQKASQRVRLRCRTRTGKRSCGASIEPCRVLVIATSQDIWQPGWKGNPKIIIL